jgi:hypothetical protein
MKTRKMKLMPPNTPGGLQLAPGTAGPIAHAAGDTDYVCAKCDRVLYAKAESQKMFGMIFRCSCGAVNTIPTEDHGN